MQGKGRFLEKTNKISLLFFLVLFSKILIANDLNIEILNYNNSLKNSSFNFIQTDGRTLEEGIIYIGQERIKIDYLKPKKISVVLSKKRGMYLNHDLKEAQFFNTNKSLVKIFFKILIDENFLENTNISFSNNEIVLKNISKIDNVSYLIDIIYENDPIKLRKIRVQNKDQNIEMGFFNHNNLTVYGKKFFSLINPFLKN